MGKSGGRKKKSGGGSNQVNSSETTASSKPVVNGGIDFDASVFLKRAHELKEEGNKKFQSKDFQGAFDQYSNALKLIPKNHPDRAVFHSNRAACLMQMKPIDYDNVIAECSMALKVQPGFTRALLRRARALEAVGKYELAVQDVNLLLGADPNHKDATEMSRRLMMAGSSPQSRPSPAALGASAALGGPVNGLGPCLPSRSVQKKVAPSSSSSSASSPVGSLALPISSNSSSKMERQQMNPVTENGHEGKTHMPKIVLKPLNDASKGAMKADQSSSSVAVPTLEKRTRWRPLKFVYDHDIRLGQMPVNCGFKVLREIVRNRFPSSKSVLIKYKDNDGDLVTVTSTAELRLAETVADGVLTKEPEADKSDSVGMLRLHVVDVSPEQEPPLPEEEEEEEEVEEKAVEEDIRTSLSETVSETEISNEKLDKEKASSSEDPEMKELEMDDWLFDFAQLFRSHVGIDPDAHVDLHELGMELCSEALEETVTSKEAQPLFEKAAAKFQEVAALAFFNWGNVHMCAARKRIPLEESAEKEKVAEQLQTAYEWVKERYTVAKEKYEYALSIKPDFYEGLLALGQQQFEMAKLHWSFALAQKTDLSVWDSTETLKLFDSAEEKMKAATEMWEKLEEQRMNDLKNPKGSKKEEVSKRRKKQGDGENGEASEAVTAAEAAEQAIAMRSQIHLFWGNMLFERSQVECKISLSGWKKNLDSAVERFKLAGASETDISTVVKNHCSNEAAVEGDEKKVTEL